MLLQVGYLFFIVDGRYPLGRSSATRARELRYLSSWFSKAHALRQLLRMEVPKIILGSLIRYHTVYKCGLAVGITIANLSNRVRLLV